ncbi:hypothetical protein JCM19992_20710 [Thermostilla marina]
MKSWAWLFIVVCSIGSASAADWPQWRHDGMRSAATDENLPRRLSLQWRVALGSPDPAYDHQYRMCADVTYAPVVGDGTVFVPSNVSDEVLAVGLETGELRWRTVVGGPVRFAPIYDAGRVYFVSDDGFLYCVDAQNGRLVWRTRGAPEELPDARMLINGRLVSRWPARGAPVLADGVIYFGAGIWPEEGAYVVAVEAATGKVLWRSEALSLVEDGMCDHGRNYDLALPPQGYTAVFGKYVVVSSGRTLAAWFDRETGQMEPYTSFYVKYTPPRGTWYVAGNEDVWVQGGNWFAVHPDYLPPRPDGLSDLVIPLIWSAKEPEAALACLARRPFLRSDRPEELVANGGYENLYSEPVFTCDTAYAAVYDDPAKYLLLRGRTFVRFRPMDKIVAYDLTKPTWSVGGDAVDSGKKPRGKIGTVEFPVKWELKTPLRVLAKAGDRLIAGGVDRIALIDIPSPGESPKISWDAPVEGNPVHVAVADGKLVVATDKGDIDCFGSGPTSDIAARLPVEATARRLTSYTAVLGWGDGQAAIAAAARPNVRVVVLERDEQATAAARNELAARGIAARRVHVVPVSRDTLVTPYWAETVIVNDPNAFGSHEDTVRRAVSLLRPLTGKLELAGLKEEVVRRCVDGRSDFRIEANTLLRTGLPPGSADWTHESADADNSFVGKDRLVKWPLGVLWYSGDIDRYFTPEAHYQHARNPYPLVKDGRMFLITENRVHAVDVYTGAYLWCVELPMTPYVSTRLFDNRLYGRPTERNIVAADDWVYCVLDDSIWCIDVESAKHVATLTLPDEVKDAAKWDFTLPVRRMVTETGEEVAVRTQPAWIEVRLSGDVLTAVVGKQLIAIDRHTGALLWRRPGSLGYITYAVGDGVLYGLDCAPDDFYRPRKAPSEQGTLFAIEVASGKRLWERSVVYRGWPGSDPAGVRPWMKPPVPFVGYNHKHRFVVMAHNGNNIAVYRAADGELVWQKEHPEMEFDLRIYSPNILDDYLVLSLSKYTGGMGFFVDIRTGERIHDDIEIPSARTCGRILGNAFLLSYRDAATELYDVIRNRTIPVNSMRAGCTTSFIPADGVLCGPMLGHGCVCNYPMFASVALYPTDAFEAWRPAKFREAIESADDSVVQSSR